jgi:hypothetical protein
MARQVRSLLLMTMLLLLPVAASAQGAAVVVGPNPGFKDDATLLVPSGEVWEVLSMFTELVTNTTAGNRQAALQIEVDGGIVWYSDPPGDQPAEKTRRYVAGAGLTRQDEGAATAINAKQWALPVGLLLPGGSLIRTVTFGMQATDDWTALRVLVRKYQ